MTHYKKYRQHLKKRKDSLLNFPGTAETSVQVISICSITEYGVSKK